MIFYNNQLMSNDINATLYMVTNPIPLDSFDDHEASIYIQLHDLIEQAKGLGDNPIALIEDYLDTVYIDGQSVEEIASFLFYSDKMRSALWGLKTQWDNYDKTLPEDSLMYGGMGKQAAIQLYSEITLRTYLEALAQYHHE